jgi:hypothetical protein
MENIVVTERQKTSVIIDPELWQRVRVAAVLRGVDRADAVEQGLRMWMEEEPPVQPSELDGLTKAQRAVVTTLIAALCDESRPQESRDALAKIVKWQTEELFRYKPER